MSLSTSTTNPHPPPPSPNAALARAQYAINFPHGHTTLDVPAGLCPSEHAEDPSSEYRQLAATLMLWGEANGQCVQLGIWRPGAEPVLILNSRPEPAMTIWIQHGNGHHRGMVPRMEDGGTSTVSSAASR